MEDFVLKFKRENNNFQMKLNRDIKELKSSKCIWVSADKSRNMYKVEPPKYHEILNKRIMDNYKIDKDNTIDQIIKTLAISLVNYILTIG